MPSYDVFLDDLGDPYIAQAVGTPPPEPSPDQLGYRGTPTPAELARYLSWPPLDEEQQESAQAHLDRAARLCRAYTRKRGWIGDLMAPELAEVVLSLAARTMNNPTGDARASAGQWASSPGQAEFSLTDRLILDGWRRRAA